MVRRHVGILGFTFAAISSAGVELACSSETVARAHAEGSASTFDAAADDAGVEAGGVPAPAATIHLSSCYPTAYTLTATLGGSQTFDLQVDTGSTTLAVGTTTCPTCSDAGISPLYTPSDTASDQHKQSSFVYASGTWQGDVFEDSVTIESTNSESAKAPVQVKLAAIQTQDGFYYEEKCNSPSGSLQGIIGLARAGSAAKGTNGYMDQFVAANHVPDIFAIELCPSGGTLWLGGWDSALTLGAPQYTPMMVPGQIGALAHEYAGLYEVDFKTVAVDGVKAAIGNHAAGGATVDIGTSVTILPLAAYASVTKSIAANPAFQSIFGETDRWFRASLSSSKCKRLSETREELDTALPPMTFTFGENPAIEVQAKPTESYLTQVNGKWCSALFYDDYDSAEEQHTVSAVLGAPFLRSHIVIYDRENSRIGFAPHTSCR